MDEKQDPAAASPKDMSLPGRLSRWLDQRTGVHEILKESLDEPIPGGARLAYVFGSGLLFIFISQIITGLCLALYYVPSAETAHTSVAYITKQVAAGGFLRSLHYYGSSAMIIVLALHFLQTFLYGSFKGRRELLWISGAVLAFLVLGMGFTGYLLPWDQKSYFATAVGTNIVGEIPLIGGWLSRLLRGGDTLGTLTLSRFYVAHVFLIPACIFAFIGAHIMLFRKAGPAGPMNEDPVNPKMAPEAFYPKQVLMDMAFAMLIMIGIGILAYFHPVGLGPIANPAEANFIPRPEWYYLSMFEWLKFWEGPWVVLAVVVIPGLLALAFFLMPFLDHSLERKPWRRPIPVLAVAVVLVGMLYLGVRSHTDDQRDPTVANQLVAQAKTEKAYTATPFKPYIESPGGVAAPAPASPLIAKGLALFQAHGCAGCHGTAGVGAVAPALVGVTAKYPAAQLTTLLQHPNAQMTAGHMAAVDISASDMSALLAYLGSLSPSGAANGSSAPSVAAAPAEVAALTPAPATPDEKAPASAGSPAAAGAAKQAAASPGSGQHIFEQRGCAACHGAGGTGGRAPAIQPLIAKRSDVQLLTVLKNPTAKMKAGGMQPVVASKQELTSLIAYLRTLGEPKGGNESATKPAAPEATKTATASPAASPVAGAAAPSPKTNPAPGAAPATPATVASAPAAAKPHPGHAVYVSQGCAACHGATGGGTHFAPSLVGVSAKFPGPALADVLHHPDAKMRSGGMPPVTANPAQITQLVSYLSTLNIATAPEGPAPPASGTSPAKANASSESAHRPTTAASNATKAIPMSPLAVRGQEVYVHNSCQTCHGVGGLNGTAAAPGLAGTASILPAATLKNLLLHHSTQMQNGNMPPTSMNASDMNALIAFMRAMPSNPSVQ